MPRIPVAPQPAALSTRDTTTRDPATRNDPTPDVPTGLAEAPAAPPPTPGVLVEGDIGYRFDKTPIGDPATDAAGAPQPGSPLGVRMQAMTSTSLMEVNLLDDAVDLCLERALDACPDASARVFFFADRVDGVGHAIAVDAKSRVLEAGAPMVSGRSGKPVTVETWQEQPGNQRYRFLGSIEAGPLSRSLERTAPKSEQRRAELERLGLSGVAQERFADSPHLVTTSALNLRTVPSAASQATVLTELAPGTALTPTGKKQGNWVEVQTPDDQPHQTGWVHSSYLAACTVSSPPAEPDVLTTSVLNLREAPSSASQDTVIGQLPAGARLTRTGVTSGSWMQVTGALNGQQHTGWVHSGYVTEVAPTPPPTTAGEPDFKTRTNLNLRAGPSGTVLGEFPANTKLTTTGQKNGKWVEVSGPLGGQTKTGWVHEDYLVPLRAGDPLTLAADRQAVFQEFMADERAFGANASKLAFLDRGIDKSPFKKETSEYADRLKSFSGGLTPSAPGVGQPFPALGQVPPIDAQGLDFLHADITQATVALADVGADGQLKTRWLGKNALDPTQMWSATKLVPVTLAAVEVNKRRPAADVGAMRMSDGSGAGTTFYDLAQDIVSYDAGVWRSNAASATFKRFWSRAGLEQELKNITGNNALSFRGSYGAPPLSHSPRISDANGTVLSASSHEGASGPNLLSAYDMARFMSTLGWHHHISPQSRFVGAQWSGLDDVVRACGDDSARYVDAAIGKLGLNDKIKNPVVISKLGFGHTNRTGKYELAYVAQVQFEDHSKVDQGEPAKMRSFVVSLKGTHADPVKLDARGAAEVTEIMRRIVTETL